MDLTGILVLLILSALGISMTILGYNLMLRHRDWFAKSMSFILALFGVSWLCGIVIAFAYNTDPLFILGVISAGGLGLTILAFWIITLGECAVYEEKNSTDKLTWVIIILATNILGAALYFFTRRQQRIAELGE
ncbi:MAG: PLDc N-terminal domain-containing protein [Dehalogenimonas sp.]